MGIFSGLFASDKQLERGVVFDARQLTDSGASFERINYELAMIISAYDATKSIDIPKAIATFMAFVTTVEQIIAKLDDAKRSELTLEYKKLEELKELLRAGINVNVPELRQKLIAFAKHVESKDFAYFKSLSRSEKKVAHGRAPSGFFLRRLYDDKKLEDDVFRKAKIERALSSDEHQINQRLRSLIQNIPASTHPEDVILGTTKILADYQSDIESFILIETDIDISEARKIQQINHYITFLLHLNNPAFSDVLARLETARVKADQFTYQDSLDFKKLMNLTKTLSTEVALLSASKTTIFDDVVEIPVMIAGRVPGILLKHKSRPLSKRGVVLMHGILGQKDTMLVIAKRLVLQDFVALSLDMSSHGDSKDLFRLGTNSEYFLSGVSYLRSIGIPNVALVAHSAGAASALYALCGYSLKLEQEFYVTVNEILQLSDQLSNLPLADVPEKLTEAHVGLAKQISQKYTTLKRLILNELVQHTYAQHARPTAAAFLAAPLTFQAVFPDFAANFLKKILKNDTGRKFMRSVFYLSTQGFNLAVKAASPLLKDPNNEISKSTWHPQPNEVQLLGGVFSDVYDFFDYISSVKNPYDFISFIEKLRTSKDPKISRFIEYYMKVCVYDVPKMFVFSYKDQVIKPLVKGRLIDLEKHYADFHPKKVIRYFNADHFMNSGGLDYQGSQMPKLAQDVVVFLDEYLGKGSYLTI